MITLLSVSSSATRQLLLRPSVTHPIRRNAQRFLSSSAHRVIVVGSGVAGSTAALLAAETYRLPVTMLFAGEVPTDCNSFWAQGGIIYRNYDPTSNDSPEALARDIHRAGAGLCDHRAVEKVATEGPERVRQLLLDRKGVFAQVPFDTDSETGELSLCLEASHSSPRILHKADHTGRVITEHITRAAAAHPLITQQGNTIVTDLLIQDGICVGVETLHRQSRIISQLYGHAGTILCTGGLAGIYEHSTNPTGFNALGSSVALATRAGARTQDLEFVQFHPTALFLPNEARFLLTEALRGEGAILRDANGRAFAKDYHEDGELAPRDIVARAVFAESQKTSDTHNAFLDITHRKADWLYRRFPSIHAHLALRGLDLAKNQLPVIPAAHYTCGGVATDLQGRTSIPNLYAAGEAARTGLHGGNRLASTSLLEGLVFGASVADYIGSVEGKELLDHVATITPNHNATTRKHEPTPANPQTVQRAAQLLQSLKRTMWDQVGVVRTQSGLAVAMDRLAKIQDETNDLHNSCPTPETAAVRDASYAGQAVAQAAANNRVSVGAHCILVPDADLDNEEEEMAAAR